MPSMAPASLTSSCFDAAHGETAQVAVEAAFLLPVLFALVLLMVQPVCVLYTRSVMESAAAATARLAITGGDGDADGHEAFALRRLAAVPDLDIFHAGGPLAWDVDVKYAGKGGSVRVSIEGAVRPLPLIGALSSRFGEVNDHGDVVLRVETAYRGRPSWLEGSYETWISAWG